MSYKVNLFKYVKYVTFDILLGQVSRLFLAYRDIFGFFYDILLMQIEERVTYFENFVYLMNVYSAY